MTTPNQHPFWFSWIQDEFGGSAWGYPWWLSWYYAGGSWVPAGTTGALGAIPTGGYMTVDHLRNATKGMVLTVGYNGGTGVYGYMEGVMGALNPNTTWPWGGNRVWEVGFYPNSIILAVTGQYGDGYFTYMHIGGNTYARTSAARYVDAGNNLTYWQWDGVGNPFPGVGGTTAVRFS